jgi:hypothetical protein
MRLRSLLRPAASGSAIALTAALLAAPLPVHAGWAGSSAITTWDGGCSGGTRDYWDDMCMAWRNQMNFLGWDEWARNFDLVQGKRYVDDSVKSWGIDDTDAGLDWNDAGMMCLHGGWKAGFWKGTVHDPDPGGSCKAAAVKMRVGGDSGGWMRFLHLSSCNSVRHSQRTQWFDAAEGVHVITGFHGLMYIGYWYVGEYSTLAVDGMLVRGVGKAWLDDMHHVNHWYNVYKTICPMSVGFGKTKQAARNAQDERYSTNWSDVTPNFMNTRWIAECDPDDGPPLPK